MRRRSVVTSCLRRESRSLGEMLVADLAEIAYALYVVVLLRILTSLASCAVAASCCMVTGSSNGVVMHTLSFGLLVLLRLILLRLVGDCSTGIRELLLRCMVTVDNCIAVLGGDGVRRVLYVLDRSHVVEEASEGCLDAGEGVEPFPEICCRGVVVGGLFRRCSHLVYSLNSWNPIGSDVFEVRYRGLEDLGNNLRF